MTPYFLILALLLGLAPAIIAHGKGRNFLVWWLYGALLGPVALIHSIMLRGRQQPRTAMLRDSSESQTPWGSPWPLMLRIAASFAIAIVAVAAYRYFVPPASETTADNREIALSADRTPPAQPSESAANGAEKSIEPKSQGDSPAVAKPALPAAGASEAASASGASEATPLPPSPAVSGPAVPSPTVNVTAREDSAAAAEDAPKPAAPAKAADTAEPAPQPQEQAAAPPPPPPSPVPPAKQLERTVPLERTVAEKPDPAPKEEQAPVRDVGKLAARTAPVEPAAADPVISATPREDSLQRERPEEPARRKPATRKAATPKPAPPPPAPAPTDVTAVGETVRVVQQALAERGYDPGPPNGRAGRQTELAIRKFQEDRGLKPSGTIDYAVLESLNIVGPRVHAFQPPPGATLGR